MIKKTYFERGCRRGPERLGSVHDRGHQRLGRGDHRRQPARQIPAQVQEQDAGHGLHDRTAVQGPGRTRRIAHSRSQMVVVNPHLILFNYLINFV